MKFDTWPHFIGMLIQKILLYNFLLSRYEQDNVTNCESDNSGLAGNLVVYGNAIHE